jgi:hypothetical protein
MMRGQVLGRDKSVIDPDLDKNTTEIWIALGPGKSMNDPGPGRIMAGMLTTVTSMGEVSIGGV